MSKSLDLETVKHAIEQYETKGEGRKPPYERGLLKGYYAALEDIFILLERDNREGMMHSEIWDDV